MNLRRILLLSITIIIGVYMLLASNNIKHPVLGDSTKKQNSIIKEWEARVDTQGTVIIEVTPIELSSKDLEWKFNVGLNTHSLELDQDMTRATVLVDDKGKEYNPIRWEGAGQGGHHREGVLVFKSITPMPKFVELKIVNIDVPVRSFIWNIIN